MAASVTDCNDKTEKKRNDREMTGYALKDELNYDEPRAHGCRGKYQIFSEAEAKINNCEMNGAIHIGFASYINSGFIRSYTQIGRYCSIGRDVSIGLGTHDLDAFTTSPWFGVLRIPTQRLAQSDPKRRVIIGHDVWVGDGAMIASGVKIGNGAVIAAGTIVTKDVAPYAIVAGAPARFLRSRFETDLVEKLQSSEWWEYEPRALQAVLGADVHKSIDKIIRAKLPKNNLEVYKISS
jgi:acetyltransferase-like isoleucine patch superfamily enzyme